MKVSIIIPIYKESDLDLKISQILAEMDGLDFEIILSIAQDDTDLNSKRYSNIPSLPEIRCLLSPKGRGIQLQNAVESATGDIIIFLHADTILTRNQILEIIERSENYDYGAFKLRINNSRIIFRIIESFVNLRTKIFKLPYGDQTIFIKRDILKAIGGVKKIPLFEDVELMLRCKRNRLKFYLSTFNSTTSDRRWLTNGIFKTIFKNQLLLLLYFLGIKEEKLYSVYYRIKQL